MRTFDYELDHIDPRWEEGRHYQRVCGLDESCNYCERESALNQGKSNRFLPWRVSVNELGTVPVEQGDLCLFLVGADIEQDIPGEWVLMEFLSEEWFAASKGTCSRSYRKIDPDKALEGIKKWREEHPTEVQEQLKKCQQGSEIYRQNNPDHFKNTHEKAKKWREENPEKVSETLSKLIAAATTVKYMCTVTGKITTAGPLARYQRKRGIDTSNRIRL